MGYLPTKITETNKAGSSAEKKIDYKKIKKLTLGERVEFTSTFQILIQSGIPVIEALAFVENVGSLIEMDERLYRKNSAQFGEYRCSTLESFLNYQLLTN